MKHFLTTAFGFLTLWCCLAPNAWAQSVRDKVTLLDEKTGSRTRVLCTVIDHTGEFIRYRVRDDAPVTVKPSSQVISIETPQTATHIKALENYAAGNTKQAVVLFEQALTEEYRDWVRRDILAMLVKCALRQDDYAQAGNRFLILYQSDRTTQYFKSIPLMWKTSAPTAELKTSALNWMNQSTPAAKLLAASALLFDPKYQGSAKLDLQQLRSHTDERVRNLALTQLWRLELPDRKVDAATLDAWQDKIHSMPKELRGGPYFVLGEGRRLRREYDRAAMALLWVPLVYDHDYQISALACLNAADSLKAIGQEDEAMALYHEVAVRYGQSTYAQDAAQILKALQTDQAESGTSQNP